MITTIGLLDAYFDCRKRKRRTASAVMYEIDYESKLIALRDRINARTYKPGKSICFVVTRPRYREVFAASFEDRIVHHWIALRLEPLFEQIFSPRTFNCRKGKGQLYGVKMLQSDVRRCSRDYTQDCYIMKLDLQGFFMSINRAMLADMLDDFIVEKYKNADDRDDLRYLSRTVILHCPENNCEKHSPAYMWNYLPPNKSLFTNGEGLGVAIGNLFSQLFANYLLNVLDWYLLNQLGFAYVGRYVDDFYIIYRYKEKLLQAVPKIRELLARYGLRLSPTKFYLQHYSKGVTFTGNVVKLNRIYICNRTAKKFVMAIRRLNRAEIPEEAEHAVSSINSYLGFLRQCNEFKLRRKILQKMEPNAFKYAYIKGPYEVVALKNKYKPRVKTLQRIRDGTY
ncbi:MAG: reverse transcriptase domain-containing protein [Bacteroidales bacterium]|nr:reverse transcriptase domain-containing protein [Bacteroidales bacterium]